MEILYEPLLVPLRSVATQIDHILNVFYNIFINIFSFGETGFIRLVVSTIMNNEYLLISVSILILGFVIGILARLIRT